MRLAALAAAAVLLAACGASQRPAPRPKAGGSPPAPASTPAPQGSVFVIVMENRSYDEASSQPYVSQLAKRFAVASDYHAVAHPSLPNYLALTSGSTHGISDDGYYKLPAGGLGQELTEHGVSWRAYMEGMSAGCFDSPYPYAVKHNPFAYYGGSCPSNVVPLTTLDHDLAGDTPRFVWITPDMCHDGHDCSGDQPDQFLSQLVPKILASRAWKDGGVLFLTWDEGESSGSNRVLTLVAAPDLKAHQTAAPHDHYSLLRTVEDRLGVPPLGRAAAATPFSELLPSA
jgi:hypothetical protein